MTDDRPVLHVPARDVPVPPMLSPEAQAVLSMPRLEQPPLPRLDDLDGWRAHTADADELIATMMAERVASARVTSSELDVDGVRVYEIVPDSLPDTDRRIYLDIHGGGFITGSGEACRAMSTGTAQRVGARVWSVDYRLPPDHRAPAALEDCVTVYRRLLDEHDPSEIIVGGGSAGGNLAAALLLQAKAQGLSLPAALVLLTPVTDLTESSDSIHTNLGVDNMLGRHTDQFRLYAGDVPLDDPRVSPIYGDVSGFPPTILTTGTRDLLLSDTVRMHRALRKAAVAAELHVTEAAGHVAFFGTAPEDHEIEREIRAFCDRHWPGM